MEFTEHQLCEPLLVKDLLAKEQIGTQATKTLVGHQAIDLLVMEVVFSPQECYSYSLFSYCIKKFENFYTITK